MAVVKRLNNLDYLRLFLALEVVLIHLWSRTAPEYLRWMIEPVPTFVCLSGFLIPGSFDASKNWQHFAWKRFLRVYPAFAISMVLTFLLLGLPGFMAALFTYLTMGLVVPGPGNLPLWSLMVEEILYASHVLARLRNRWNAEAAGVCFAITLGVSTALNWPHRPIGPALAVDGIIRAAAAYFLGNIAYFNKPKLSRASGLLAIGFGLACVAARVYSVSVLAPALICGMALASVLAANNLPQIIQRIPDASYGIYIYHFGIYIWLIRHGYSAWWTLPAVLALAFVSAIIVEQPLLKSKDRTWKLPKKSPEPKIPETATA
jgi:peptidoglycan/LPS O-acetylase OafA/YrhL